MNATKHSATGYAPASIITPGIDLNEGILFRTVLPGDTTSLLDTLNCSDKQAFVVKTVSLVSNTPNTNNAMQTNIRLHHFQKTRLFWLAILKGPARQPNYMLQHGPLVLSNEGSRYSLLNLITGKSLDRHISLLTAFDTTRCSPLDVASRDTDAYNEKILDHRRDKKNIIPTF
jgi:hypothetical protein